MATKKSTGKTKRNRVSNADPGVPSKKTDLQFNGCGAHSCGAVTHAKTGNAASDVEIAAAEANGGEIPEV